MASLEPGRHDRSPEEEHNTNTLDPLSKESIISDTPKPDLPVQEKQREVALLERSLWRLERSVLPGLRRDIAERNLDELASLRETVLKFEEAISRRHPLQDQDHEARSSALDFGHFPKPGRKAKTYDGSKPLTDPRHEATAQYFATPEEIRNVRSVTELAQRIGVTRKTVYEWIKDPVVLLRCDWLSEDTRALGRLAAKRESVGVVEALIAQAEAGDAKAARLVLHIAWPEDWPLGGYRRDRKYRRNCDVQRSLDAERIDPDAGPGDGHGDSGPSKLGTDSE